LAAIHIKTSFYSLWRWLTPRVSCTFSVLAVLFHCCPLSGISQTPAINDGNSDHANYRESLLALQAKVRTVAAKKGFVSGKLRIDYYSAELETDLPELLQAHIAFGSGLLAGMEANQEKAMESWKESLLLLRKTGGQGKPWLRRSYAAIAARMIVDLHHKRDIPGMLAILLQANEVINRNPLPESEDSPYGQLRVEHWLNSSLKMFEAVQQLENAPRDYEVQMRILRQTLHQVSAARLLMGSLADQEKTSSHEQIVDRAVFEGDFAGMFTSLFYNIRVAGESLPSSAQAVWTSLLSAWATEATSAGLTGAAFDESRLSPPEAADRFRALAEAVTILDEYRFPDARQKLAKGLSFLNPAECPPDETALAIADVLIEGGQIWKAAPYLEMTEKAGLTSQVQCAWVKLLFHAAEFQKAVEYGQEAFGNSGDKLPSETHFWLAKALLKTGKQKEAKEEFRQYYAAEPESELAPEACLLIGMLSFNLDDPKEAERYYQETAIRYPASREGQRAAEMIAK